jgi:hypothetical protein
MQLYFYALKWPEDDYIPLETCFPVILSDLHTNK